MIRTTTNHPVIGCPVCEDGILNQEWRVLFVDTEFGEEEVDVLMRVCDKCGFEEDV